MTLLPIALVAVLVLGAIMIMPKKKDTAPPPSEVRQDFAPSWMSAPAPVQQVSFRQQQLTEEADAVAEIYKQRSQDAWRAKVAAEAALILSPEPKEIE